MSHITVIAGSFCSADRVFTGPAIQSNESVWNGLWSLVGFFLAMKVQLIIFGRCRKLLLLMHTLSILLSLYVSPPLPPHVFTASPTVGPVFSSLWALKISTSRERQIERERKRDSHAGFYYAAFLTCETSCKCSLRRQTEEPLCTCSHINRTFLMRVCVPVGLIRLNGSCVMTSSAVTQYVLTRLSTSLVKITIFTCDQYIYLFI